MMKEETKQKIIKRVREQYGDEETIEETYLRIGIELQRVWQRLNDDAFRKQNEIDPSDHTVYPIGVSDSVWEQMVEDAGYNEETDPVVLLINVCIKELEGKEIVVCWLNIMEQAIQFLK